MEMARLIDAIKNMPEVEQKKKDALETIDKILGIYFSWNGEPADLDTSSFTIEEVKNVIDYLAEHDEAGLNYGIEKEDPVSVHFTASNLIRYIALKQKQISKEVLYI